MFKQLKRVVYPVTDLASAKAWYSEILGAHPLFDTPAAVIFLLGGCTLSLVQRTAADTPSQTDVEVYWEVEDVEAALDTLIGKGARLHTPMRAILKIRTARVIDPFGNVLGLTDQGSARDSSPATDKPSQTAVNVAFCRALAARDERPGLTGPDDLAELFLDGEPRELLKSPDTRRWAVERLVSSQLYGLLLARTAYFDEVFIEQCALGIPQIVLLGAGYDTRAIRFRDAIHQTRVFEVDLTTTQARKRQRLDAAGVSTPDELTYVPFNFESQDLGEVLGQVGFDRARRTLFLWEGVLYYLTRAAVVSTLRSLAAESAAQSIFLLDCPRSELVSVNPAEPFRFWMTPDDLTALLGEHGWRVSEVLDSAQIMRRFLTMPDGSQAEQCLPHFFFLQAVKA